jgi:hypothetical protein
MSENLIQLYLNLPASPLFLFLLSFSLLATIAFRAKLVEADQTLKPYNIASLEFAWTPHKAKAILSGGQGNGVGEEWEKRKVNAAQQSLLWDFPFLLAYAPLISALVLLAAQQVPELTRINLVLSLAPFVAAGLDVIENLALLRVLAQLPSPSALLLRVAAIAAGLKFALVIVSVLYVPGVALYRLMS